MRGFDAHPAAPWDWAWITGNPEVIGSPVGLVPTNALVLINGDKLRLVGSPSVILGPDLTGDKLHGPMGIETTFQSSVKRWIKLPGES